MNDVRQNDIAKNNAEPLDAFEKQWTALLADESHVDGDPAFVQAVLDRYEKAQRPAVIARIGWGVAAAAAVGLAAVIGVVAMNNTQIPSSKPIVDNVTPPTEVAAVDPAEESARQAAAALNLGALFGRTSSSVIEPTAGIPRQIQRTTGQLNLTTLVRGINTALPDASELRPAKNDETDRG